MQSNLTVYFACTSTNCKNLKFLFVKKGQKKYVVSSGLLRTFDMLFYDIETIDGQKFSLILFYSIFKPIFTRLCRSSLDRWINGCILVLHSLAISNVGPLTFGTSLS